MRSFLLSRVLCVSVGVLAACSEDAGPERAQGALGSEDDGSAAAGSGASASAGTAGSAGASAGSAGSSAAAGGSGAGAGAPNAAGSSGEGVDVEAPLDTTTDGEGSGSGAGASADAGAPVVGSVCPSGPFAENPIPAGATPAVACQGMTFTEGAVWFQELNTLFFSDFQFQNAASNASGRIMRYSPGGTCDEFITEGGTNGLVIAPDGNLLGARHSDQTLTIFDLETQEPTVLVADNDGLSFNSPNDIAVRSDGNIYFTDPTYLLSGRASEQPARAYRRDPSGVLTVIDEGVDANGITLSPDETRLYLSHLPLGGGQANVVVYDVDASGALSEPQPFIPNTGSDGMAIDCAGNLYITSGGVQVFSPAGEPLGTIAAPGAANVAFGGPERRTLYITAGAQLLEVELAIPGLPY